MPIKARPTMYAGIPMRSRLEATFAAFLDENGFVWEYEPRAYAAPGRPQWLPDFEVWLGGRRGLVEVKGDIGSAEAARALRLRMAVAWESEPEAILIVAEATSTYLRAGTPIGWAWASFVECPGCGDVRLAFHTRKRPSCDAGCSDRFWQLFHFEWRAP